MSEGKENTTGSEAKVPVAERVARKKEEVLATIQQQAGVRITMRDAINVVSGIVIGVAGFAAGCWIAKRKA